jgi:hypothetical protein
MSTFPDDVARVSILLCGLEAAAAHEATFTSRASEYGPVLAGLLESARAFDALAMAEIVLCREAFRVASVPTRHGPSPMPPSTAAAPDAGSRIIAPPEPTMRGTSNRSDTGSPVEADRGNGAVAPAAGVHRLACELPLSMLGSRSAAGALRGNLTHLRLS